MASFESKHVIHPTREKAEEWAARVERRGVKFRSATSGRYVAKTASGEASQAGMDRQVVPERQRAADARADETRGQTPGI